jgi:outer membrane autotransporter protein
MDVWMLQVGMDRPVRETGDGILIAGLTFSYGTVDSNVSSGSGDGGIATDGFGFGGTLTWVRDDDLYVDGQAQLMWFDSDLRSDVIDEDLVAGNDGFGYALGVEVGKRVPLKPAWTVTPQAQLIYSSVDFDSFTDPFGAEVGGEEGASMPVRLGLSLDQESGWKGEGGDGRRTHFYGIANLYYDLVADTEVTVGDAGLTSQGDQFWGSVGVGGTYSWADGRYAVYGEGLVSSSLANLGDSYANSATVGVRIAW